MHPDVADRLSDALTGIIGPHQIAEPFLTEMEAHNSCLPHSLRAAWLLSAPSTVAPCTIPEIKRAARQMLSEEVRRWRCCGKAALKTSDRHQDDFDRPPADLVHKVRDILPDAASYQKRLRIVDCELDGHPVVADCLRRMEHIQQVMTGNVAGTMVQYSLVLPDKQSFYAGKVHTHLADRIAALERMIGVCAMTLRRPDSWRGRRAGARDLATRWLRSSTANHTVNAHSVADLPRYLSWLNAHRRIADLPADLQAGLVPETSLAETTAFWMEIADNFAPRNRQERDQYGIQPGVLEP